MNQLESNIARSFRRARKDIDDLKTRLSLISKRQQETLNLIGNKKSSSVKKTKNVVKVVKTVKPKTKSKTFVASKEGKKFHIKECPYAQNIKPKSKLIFKSKNTALNKGFKPCSCVK